VADVSWDGQRDAGRAWLPDAGAALPGDLPAIFDELESTGRDALLRDGVAEDALRVERRLDLRYAGTETPLAVREPGDGDWTAAFAADHATRFGYTRTGRPVEIVTARVRVFARSADEDAPAAEPEVPAQDPTPLRTERVWFPDVGRVEAPVLARETLQPGVEVRGPALVLEDTGTVVLDPGFVLRVDPRGLLRLSDEAGRSRPAPGDLSRPDPIRLEVFGNRFMSIAEQMGAVLRNTSVSTNIKERLDYSCAVFDAAGGLVANAPHIPVHLGAMDETVRMVRERFPDLAPGDVVVTNDPFAGGSHLPDVTVVTPVFIATRGPAFFVASRGHHADIGGTTPGSMPADSQTLSEEGVLLEPFLVVRGGRFDEARLRQALTGARHPARSPDDNVAELEAMVAANRCGVGLVEALVAEQGARAVTVTMEQLQEAAAGRVRREIGRLPDGEHAFEDFLDDGTPVRVTLSVRGEHMRVDFAGTGSAVAGNLNTPHAVVRAATIYVLRALVAEPIPLNGGCLLPVEIAIPPGSLLDPPRGAAVVGGNVETSQRVVDVLLGALGRVAASQGTMNNVTFGDATFGYYETISGASAALRPAPRLGRCGALARGRRPGACLRVPRPGHDVAPHATSRHRALRRGRRIAGAPGAQPHRARRRQRRGAALPRHARARRGRPPRGGDPRRRRLRRAAPVAGDPADRVARDIAKPILTGVGAIRAASSPVRVLPPFPPQPTVRGSSPRALTKKSAVTRPTCSKLLVLVSTHHACGTM
jgi:5-oxoprolinase (ATP-hydrolysing)